MESSGSGALPPPPPPPPKRKRTASVNPSGPLVDKSCSRCRIRKVRCDRNFPTCTNCVERRELCDLAAVQLATPPSQLVLASSADSEDTRIARLEQRLAQLESHSPRPVYHPNAPNLGSLQLQAAAMRYNILSPPRNDSLDWRLASPLLAKSLSQHLCEAFLDSCCSHLPAFTYFHDRLPNFRGDLSQLHASAKVSIAAFCAIGARASPHSALLGIASAPDDARIHPQAPLLNAGSRRENACTVLLGQAHTLCYEAGLVDVATRDNLAAILAMMQMTIFVELEPKKSRSLVRVALGHFKDLQDQAKTEEERSEIKRSFALPLYSGDSITAAYVRKNCLISDSDLRRYFDHVGIVIPKIPGEDLLLILDTLLSGNHPKTVSVQTATHLLGCWMFACQRKFAAISSPATVRVMDLVTQIPALWSAIDQARAGIAFVQSSLFAQGSTLSQSQYHQSSKTPPHDHAHDYLTMIVRHDRDLLDVGSMMHVLLEEKRDAGELESAQGVALLRESTRRIRQGLKTLAYYAKVYMTGVDRHLIFHLAFQLELNPNWARMALQRVGDLGGPESLEEELSQMEINWFIEGMQGACYYMPAAEKRLAELTASRFHSLDVRVDSASPLPTFDPLARRPSNTTPIDSSHLDVDTTSLPSPDFYTSLYPDFFEPDSLPSPTVEYGQIPPPGSNPGPY